MKQKIRVAFKAVMYVGVLINRWIFLFFYLQLKKLEQRSHKCAELRGNMQSK
jgi:hypothetical protein